MPKGMYPRGGTATPAPPQHDPLMADPLDLASEMSYSQILASAGAYRVPGRGIVHKLATSGKPYQRNGRWFTPGKVYPVAMTAEEAREKTRQTGERWDYYEAGARCKQCAEVTGNAVISGWVLGGRKFQSEHAHVTDFDPEVYVEMETDPPEDSDEAAAPDAGPVLVGAGGQTVG